jgi:hypothetical protein
MIRTLAIATALAAALLSPGPALSAGPDFPTLVRSALAGNQQLVGQVRPALPTGDLGALKTQSGSALGTAEQVQSLLSQALVLAPDDASRSRVEGLVRHINGAVDPLRMAAQEPSVDGTLGRLNQARGEAEEALSEFVTFANQLPAPQPEALPKTGGLGGLELAVVSALGLALSLGGRALRGAAFSGSPR